MFVQYIIQLLKRGKQYEVFTHNGRIGREWEDEVAAMGGNWWGSGPTNYRVYSFHTLEKALNDPKNGFKVRTSTYPRVS